jgi:hypothetical protein
MNDDFMDIIDPWGARFSGIGLHAVGKKKAAKKRKAKKTPKCVPGCQCDCHDPILRAGDREHPGQPCYGKP